ncbi:MAG: hypothetical protein ACD_19C00014G0019 [uncultured bacterium]|nr:MAG: hypothetical protein ACD_19C00014G0019 [uncultured bacterium]
MQSEELIFKGFCYFKKQIPDKTHDLSKLLKKCEELGLNINDEIIEGSSKLTKYYMESRYPDMLPSELYDEDEAVEALKIAQEIVKSVKLQLK